MNKKIFKIYNLVINKIKIYEKMKASSFLFESKFGT